MIPRYEDKEIVILSSQEERLKRFDDVEIAAIRGEEKAGRIMAGLADKLEVALKASPPDEVRRKEIENINKHDVMAYVMQRWEVLAKTPKLMAIFHKGKTSLDIQDNADQLGLLAVISIIEKRLIEFMGVVKKQSIKYWNVYLLARTHGQGVHVTRFGKRLASYLADLKQALDFLRYAKGKARYGKLSGIVGDYRNTPPEVEEYALAELELEPYIGATQILPRVIHAILASSIAVICGVLAKVADDFQLMARSPNPLIQEPFSEEQIGSSADPAKRNTINAENTVGMFRLSLGNLVALFQNLMTKEERDIAQSSVERVALIDDLHIVMKALQNMIYIIDKMVVYPDRMLKEIEDMRGADSAEAAKEFLVTEGLKVGLTREDAYNIVKQAAHMVVQPDELERDLRVKIPESDAEALANYKRFMQRDKTVIKCNVRDIIATASLMAVSTTKTAAGTIAGWNRSLLMIFRDTMTLARWNKIFEPSLVNMEIIREKIVDIDIV